MPDFFGVYDDLTVQEYLEFYAESYFVSARVRRSTVSDLLELIDLTTKRNEYVESLSRGMKQRLGLARCLVQDGRLIREGPVDQVLGSMSAGRGVELRAFASREAVVSMLEQHPLVGAIETNVEDDGQADDADLSACTVTFRTSADDAGLRDMLRVLVEAGLGVVTFSSVRDNLEDVFMQLTDQSGDEVAN
jgi:ABC-2 type transport system ATP-binding protein